MTHERIHDDTVRDHAGAARALTRGDAEYPALLLALPTAPSTLHVRGSLVEGDALAVAVVGSGRATPYGLEVAETLGGELAAAGVTIVSGLARGIDTAAHRGALRVGGPQHRGARLRGWTWCTRRRRAARRRDRRARGARLEFAPGTPPLPHHFPTRSAR